MNYRSEIEDLARYFNSLNSIYKKYFYDGYYNELRFGRISELKFKLRKIFDELIDKYPDMSQKIVKAMTIHIDMRSAFFFTRVQIGGIYFLYSLNIKTMDFLSLLRTLKPRSYPVIYAKENSERWGMEGVINLSLNYETIRSLLRPEDYALLDKIWELYFGNVE